MGSCQNSLGPLSHGSPMQFALSHLGPIRSFMVIDGFVKGDAVH